MSLRSLFLVLRILPCIPWCFHLLHDRTTNFPLGLDTTSYTSFLLNWSFLYYFLLLHWWCRCIRHIILHLELSLLVLRNKSHPCLLVGDCVCDLSYKENAFVRNIHTGKFLCINIWSCNYLSQYNIHPYLTKTFLDAFHLYEDDIEIVH